jgi:glycyl-tRNA synthetase
MFITKKKISGKEYYYLQKSVREGDKVISKSIAYLGKDKEEAEKKAEQIKKEMEIPNEKKVENILIKKDIDVEELAGFCKRKGFVYPSGDIYGGLAGFWDFGHLGNELKNNILKEWWDYHVKQRDDVVGIDGSIITNPKVWEASGHVGSFVDVAVVNKKTGEKTKVDRHEVESLDKDVWEVKGEFNPMFTTQIGPINDESSLAYLRPETAQLIFANFKLIQENTRMKLPFGIAQFGKSFRNEISPREFLFRAREFEQMEIEYFIESSMECPHMEEVKGTNILIYDENTQKKNKEPQLMDLYDAWKEKIIKTDWHAYWIAKEYEWFLSLGVNSDNLRVRQHTSDEKSHYAIDTWDLEYKFPMGWRELQGFANRGDFDLKQHQEYSKSSMEIDDNGNKVLSHVVCEPSLGMGRAFMVFMFDSYYFDEKRNNTVLKLNPRLAPVKAAVFPIIKSPEYEEIAQEILIDLRKEFNVNYDKSGSIGRRYARNDEIGTPFCITIDDKSLKEKNVTIRDRNTTKQIRVKINDLRDILRKLIYQDIKFEEAGRLI